MNDKLSHVDESGAARMVDVSGKPETHRRARATGVIRMRPATLRVELGQKWRPLHPSPSRF